MDSNVLQVIMFHCGTIKDVLSLSMVNHRTRNYYNRNKSQLLWMHVNFETRIIIDRKIGNLEVSNNKDIITNNNLKDFDKKLEVFGDYIDHMVYKKLEVFGDYIDHITDKFLSPTDSVILAAKYGLINMFKHLYKGDIINEVDLADLCNYNQLNIIKAAIECGADDFSGGFYAACRFKHIDVVKLMINYGANNFNLGLLFASRFGHIDIVKLMIEYGADDFNIGLIYAAQYGYIDIAELMLQYGANIFDAALVLANKYGYKDIARLIETFNC